MYVSLGAIAPAELPCWEKGSARPCKFTTEAAVSERLPECYSAELEACRHGFRDAIDHGRLPEVTPACAPYYEVWRDSSDAAWTAAVEAMPYCPAPKPGIGVGMAVGIGGVALLAGLGVGMLIARR